MFLLTLLALPLLLLLALGAAVAIEDGRRAVAASREKRETAQKLARVWGTAPNN